MPDLVIHPGGEGGPAVWVAAEDLDFRAVRAGGPGGQHVNKVSSKIELRVAIAGIQGLDPGACERLCHLAGRRLSADGDLLITASESRHQFANKQDALEKLVTLVRSSLTPPKPRKPTRASRASKERRITGKKLQGEKKRDRGKVDKD